MKPPAYVPTEAQRTLDREIEARRQKLETEGHATKLERMDTIIPSNPEGVIGLAEVMPEVLATFERMEARSRTFFDTIRGQMAESPQWLPCDQHGETLRALDFDLTCRESRETGRYAPTYAPCGKCAEIVAEATRRLGWARRGVPERVMSATFDNFQTDTPEKAKAVQTVRDWSGRRGTFLVLLGSTGTGKGHLASAALKAQGAGLWVTHLDMLADLRTSYNTRTTAEVVATWQDAELFVLDEFGLSAGGKDEEPLLYQVLAERHDKRRPTIITTNLPPETLRMQLGFRLLNRIREDVTQISMVWPSYRTSK